jgi:hypothetical protein
MNWLLSFGQIQLSFFQLAWNSFNSLSTKSSAAFPQTKIDGGAAMTTRGTKAAKQTKTTHP